MGFKAKQEFREVDKLIKDLSKQSLSTSTLTTSTSKHSSSPPLSTKNFQPSVVSNHRFTSTMSSATRTSLSEERHSASKAAATTTTTTNRNSIFAWRMLPILKNTSLFLLLSILRVQLLFSINEWPYLTFVSKLFKIFLDNSKVLSILRNYSISVMQNKPEEKFERNKKFRIWK